MTPSPLDLGLLFAALVSAVAVLAAVGTMLIFTEAVTRLARWVAADHPLGGGTPMPSLTFLNDPKPLTDSDLHDAERVALAGDSLAGQLAARLLIEVRRLRHELADPAYQYAGGRIHRHAVVCRDAEIERLRGQLAGKPPS